MTLRRYAAVAAYLLMGPWATEFLTGSTQLASVLRDPHPLIALAGFSVSYGGGAILIREMAKRWHKGYSSILLLGVAYGMVNEGLDSAGIFLPRFPSVVEMGIENFGRWGGINVLWALGMVVVHAVFSIAIQITIVETLFREVENERLLGNVALAVLFALFMFHSAFIMFVATTAFRRPFPDIPALLLVLILMVLFTLAARAFPRVPIARMDKKPGVMTLFILGFAGSLAFFRTYLDLHRYIPSPVLNILALLVLLLLFSILLLRLPETSERDRLALAAGVYGVMILGAIGGGRIMPAGVVVVLLALAWLKSGRRSQGPQPAETPKI